MYNDPIQQASDELEQFWKPPEYNKANNQAVSKLLDELTVGKDYIDDLADAEWVVENLIMLGHILNLLAKPGTGKTALSFFNLAPLLAKNGFDVVYIDCDSPTTDHKKMFDVAQRCGFRWINPHTKKGKSIKDVLAMLQKMAHMDLKGFILFFDTYKKFVNLMNKDQVKQFANLQRALQGRGATSINLGHCNKERDKISGALIYEGTGDVLADCDDLIYLEKIESELYDGAVLSTVWDQKDYTGKVRGLFEQISINLREDRTAVFLEEFVEIPDYKPGRGRKPQVSDDNVKAMVKVSLKMFGEVSMGDLSDSVMQSSGCSREHAKRIIKEMFRDDILKHRRDGARDLYSIK